MSTLVLPRLTTLTLDQLQVRAREFSEATQAMKEQRRLLRESRLDQFSRTCIGLAILLEPGALADLSGRVVCQAGGMTLQSVYDYAPAKGGKGPRHAWSGFARPEMTAHGPLFHVRYDVDLDEQAAVLRPRELQVAARLDRDMTRYSMTDVAAFQRALGETIEPLHVDRDLYEFPVAMLPDPQRLDRLTLANRLAPLSHARFVHVLRCGHIRTSGVAGLVSVAANGDFREVTVVPQALEHKQQVYIAGPLAEVLVEDGQMVQEGGVLFREYGPFKGGLNAIGWPKHTEEAWRSAGQLLGEDARDHLAWAFTANEIIEGDGVCYGPADAMTRLYGAQGLDPAEVVFDLTPHAGNTDDQLDAVFLPPWPQAKRDSEVRVARQRLKLTFACRSHAVDERVS